MSHKRNKKDGKLDDGRITATNKKKESTKNRRKNKEEIFDPKSYIKNNITIILFVLIIVIIAVSFGWTVYSSSLNHPGTTNSSPGSSTNNITSSSNLTGKHIIDFTEIDTQNVSLSLSDFSGRPMLLEFFATGCPHCIEEGHILNDLYHNYSSKIIFYSVGTWWNVDTSSTQNLTMVTAYQSDNGYSWFFSCTTQYQNYILNEYNVNYNGVPSIFLINSAGVIKYVYLGTTSYTILAPALNSLN
ncbi:MAG: TlpA family protein disulfide reductase [Candidatus Thermoplasmatota archaeon]|jgi:peroxiredoxin|nr:TlpA family protein disulfide reductase [Candidatus Thermoplasmatota archaeon]MCL5963869.1 TlpA family protein disulfide reductase [Candidatus Thermoplasmatota archaeon]